jgi:hypothetical protein
MQDTIEQIAADASCHLVYRTTAIHLSDGPHTRRATAVTGGSGHCNDGSCIKADNCRSKTMSKLKCVE